MEFGRILEFCNPKTFPSILQSSIDADLVIAIFEAIDEYFIPNSLDNHGIELLSSLTKVQRFDVVTMMMNSNDKTKIERIIKKLDGDASRLQHILKSFS